MVDYEDYSTGELPDVFGCELRNQWFYMLDRIRRAGFIGKDMQKASTYNAITQIIAIILENENLENEDKEKIFLEKVFKDLSINILDLKNKRRK